MVYFKKVKRCSESTRLLCVSFIFLTTLKTDQINRDNCGNLRLSSCDLSSPTVKPGEPQTLSKSHRLPGSQFKGLLDRI